MKTGEIMPRIYTKTGDQGDTTLFGGAKIRKSDPRVAAYGTVDEANAAIGMAAVSMEGGGIERLLRGCQKMLFVVGGELASDAAGLAKLARTVTEQDVRELENAIDDYAAQLPESFSFVMPGQSRQSAALHVARTVARRAERLIVELMDAQEVNPAILVYMNRLSDLLFVLSRFVDEVKRPS